MSRATGYPYSLARTGGRPVYPVGYDTAPPAVVEPKMPRVLGAAASLYFAGVCTLSAASESTSWIPQVIAVFIGVMWLSVGLVIYGQRFAFSRPVMYYIIFVAWASLGFLVTINSQVFFLLLMTTLKVLAITFVISQCIRTRRDLLVCFLMITITSLIVFVFARDEIMRSISFKGNTRDAYADARASTTLLGNANDLGMYGVIVIISALHCLLGYRMLLIKIISILAAVCGLYLMAASGSRTGMLGLGVGAVAFYFFHLRKLGSTSIVKKLGIGVIAFGLMIGTAYYISTLPFFFRMKEIVSSKGAAEKEPRLVYFYRALGVVASSPAMGLGLNGFALHRLGTDSSGTGHYSHSSISETLSATGLPGFLIYYAAYVSMFLQIRRLQKMDLPPKDRAAVNITMSLLLVIMAFSVVAVLFYHRLIWPLMGACCGYLWELEKQHAGTTAQPEYGPDLAYVAPHAAPRF